MHTVYINLKGKFPVIIAAAWLESHKWNLAEYDDSSAAVIV